MQCNSIYLKALHGPLEKHQYSEACFAMYNCYPL